jgi:hypothetical protein
MISIKKVCLISALSIVIFACKKRDGGDASHGGMGLKLASSAETNGVPYPPNFLAGSLAPSIILHMPPVGNQGMQGSCSSWATAYAGMSYFMNRLNGTNFSADQELCSSKFAYNQITHGNCNGTSIPSNLNILLDKGVCTLKDMPYDDIECSIQPNLTQNTTAMNSKLFAWKKVDKSDLNILKSCIAAKYPIFIAVNIDESFINLQPPYIWKVKFGEVKGAHALTVMGNDDAKNAFKVQNSWSNAWKDNGHLWIDYNSFAKAVISNECYIAFPQITGPNDNLNNGLVLNMQLSGNAKDASSNNNNGVVLSGAGLTADRYNALNSAYKFNGYANPGSITISASPSLIINSDYSLCFWARFDSRQGEDGLRNNWADGNTQISWQTIFYRGGNTVGQALAAYIILLSSQYNTFGWFLGSNGGGTTSGVYNDVNEWHHFVISKVGNILKLYKDGILLWDIRKSIFPGNGQPFHGAIDEFRIYNRALTASEV